MMSMSAFDRAAVMPNPPIQAAAFNERPQMVRVLKMQHQPYEVPRMFFPKDSKTHAPRYLFPHESPLRSEGEVFEGVVKFTVSLDAKLMTLERMPGFKGSFAIPASCRGIRLLKVPRGVHKDNKVQWLSEQAGFHVVKLAAGQIPFHLSDEQLAAAVTAVTGRTVVSVESMMHTSGKGRNGFRFIFVSEADSEHIVQIMNRLCVFKTNEICVFNPAYVASPFHWCRMLIQNAEEGQAKSLLPMTICVASQQ
jgi:hypothetical protein